MKPILFNGVLIAAVAQATAKEHDVRAFLKGVHFDGTFAVGTNGTVMTVAQDRSVDNAMPDGIAVVKFDAPTVTKFKGITGVLGAEIDPQERIVTHKGRVAPVGLVDGSYPPWRSLVPDASMTPRAKQQAWWGVNATEIIIKTAKVIKATSTLTTIYQRGRGISGLALVRYSGMDEYSDRDVFSVVMPQRDAIEVRDTRPPAPMQG